MKKLVILPAIAAVAVIAAYYASPLFINTAVDEPLPTDVTETKEMMEKEMSEKAMMEAMEEAMKKDIEVMEPMETGTTEPEIMLTGTFVGVGDGIHNAEGTARVLTIGDDQAERKILRLEEFRSTNGPDLHVYLSKDARSIGAGYVELGKLKGNIGNQNYDLPDGVDLGEYSHVLIWCKQFSVLFGYADLEAA